MARQGQAFATAQEVRVVLPPKDENDQVLVDVPRDGKTVGEIMTRGNIVMKEVILYQVESGESSANSVVVFLRSGGYQKSF